MISRRLVRIMLPFVAAGIAFTMARDHPAAYTPWTIAALACALVGVFVLQRVQRR